MTLGDVVAAADVEHGQLFVVGAVVDPLLQAPLVGR
jgi:hypothetical protein